MILEVKLNSTKENWKILRNLKIEVNQIFEEMRNNKVIKSGLETKVNVLSPNKYDKVFDNINLNDFLVCSQVNLNKDLNESKMRSLETIKDVKVLIERAAGNKCNYCWKIISRGTCERKNCPI